MLSAKAGNAPGESISGPTPPVGAHPLAAFLVEPVNAFCYSVLMVNLRLLSDRVLIRMDPRPDVTASGLHIPDNAKGLAESGVVVATGPGKYLTEAHCVAPMAVQVGDQVFFSKYQNNDYRIYDREHIILNEDDVLCVVV